MSDLDLKNHYKTGYHMLRRLAKDKKRDNPDAGEMLKELVSEYKEFVKDVADIDTDLPDLD